MSSINHNCKVCGLYIEDFPWGENGDSPTYEICPCCGVEFGNEDYTVESINEYRDKWMNEGFEWFNSKEKPKSWNKEEQFGNIFKS
ncbi:hypothetical protein O2K51_11990 [Apibacter raozihei]|uniref:hypothetical protein n=1 Tax=Apibacter TaxID=1778601 RepID=UPI000FE42766|nr:MULTISPECIES: hypothetical protein [Apibacter]